MNETELKKLIIGKWEKQDIDEHESLQPQDSFKFTDSELEYRGSMRTIDRTGPYSVEFENEQMFIKLSKIKIEICAINQVYALTKTSGVFHVWKREC